MASGWDSSGFDKLKRGLNDIANTKSVPFGEMFSPSFMSEFTDAADINQFFEAGGFSPTTQGELESIDERALDAHVASHTRFRSWSEMKVKAGELRMKRKIEGR